jgi:CheY-like chemotaxis protein
MTEIPVKRSQKILDKLRILLVDDCSDNRYFVEELLSQCGAQVWTSCDGSKAAKLVSEHQFDIVLMDLFMPIMDGYEAARQLRQLACDLPIVALTAAVVIGGREKCLKSGFDEHIPKPINIDSLLSVIRHLSSSRRLQAQLVLGSSVPSLGSN